MSIQEDGASSQSGRIGNWNKCVSWRSACRHQSRGLPSTQPKCAALRSVFGQQDNAAESEKKNPYAFNQLLESKLENKEDRGWDAASAVESKDAVGANAPGNKRVAKLPSGHGGESTGKGMRSAGGGVSGHNEKVQNQELNFV